MSAPPHDPVVFDLDGTIADSAPVIAACLRRACEAVGAPLDPDADLAFACGPPVERTLATLLGAGRVPEALRAFRAHYREIAASTPALPGAVETVVTLSEAGVRLGIATYKPVTLARTVLDALGLLGRFDVVAARSDEPGDPRSKRDVLAEALGALAPHRAEPLMVGDHDEDEAAARALGVAFFRVEADAGASFARLAAVLAGAPA